MTRQVYVTEEKSIQSTLKMYGSPYYMTRFNGLALKTVPIGGLAHTGQDNRHLIGKASNSQIEILFPCETKFRVWTVCRGERFPCKLRAKTRNFKTHMRYSTVVSPLRMK